MQTHGSFNAFEYPPASRRKLSTPAELIQVAEDLPDQEGGLYRVITG